MDLKPFIKRIPINIGYSEGPILYKSGGDTMASMVEKHESSICMNIGRKHRQARLMQGLLALVAGIGAAILMLALDLPTAYRLLLIAPFIGAGINIFQVTQKTCIVFALQNVQGLDEDSFKTEKVQDQALSRALRWRAIGVIVRGTAFGVVATALIYILPL